MLEVIYQLAILIATVWSIGATEPEAPQEAIRYYYVATFIRIVISLGITYGTLADHFDRKAIHRERGRLNLEGLLAFEKAHAVDTERSPEEVHVVGSGSDKDNRESVKINK